ncbi:MAG: hypothetical protein JW990_18245 [Thermoleophilia bacterium]|nr:hypothetical protein [Thermoleophilia bacterium]
MASKNQQPAPEPEPVEQAPGPEQGEPETVPPALEPEAAPETQTGPTPSGMKALEEAAAEPSPDPAPAAENMLLKETIILNGPASFGPVTIAGQATRCKKDVLYWVPNMAERVEILGTGRFRVATVADLERAGQPSAGPGGAITRDLLPPGAIKGGLSR